MKFPILLLKLSVGILILLFLLHKIGLNQLYSAFITANPSYIPLIIGLYFIPEFISAFGLWFLLRASNYRIYYIIILKYTLLAWSLGLLTPGKVGKFSMLYFLNKEGIKVGKATAIVFFDTFLKLILLFLIATVGFYVFFSKFYTLTFIFIFMIIVLLFFLLISNKSRYFIRRFILKRYAIKFSGFSDMLFDYIKKKKLVSLLVLSLYLFRWIVMSITLFFIFLMFNVSAELHYILLITAMAQIATIIPISLSGLGIRESVSVFLYNQIGIASGVSFSIFMSFLFIEYLLAGIFILAFFKEFNLVLTKFKVK